MPPTITIQKSISPKSSMQPFKCCLNVFPIPTFYDVPDSGIGNIKPSAYFGKVMQTLFPKSSNLNNVSVFKFRVAPSFPFSLAVFIVTVLRVLFRCTEAKVFRIAAKWGVATMHHKQGAGNITIRKLIGPTMCIIGFSIAPVNSIAMTVLTSKPQPAFVRGSNIHMTPKRGWPESFFTHDILPIKLELPFGKATHLLRMNSRKAAQRIINYSREFSNSIHPKHFNYTKIV